jgi:hypothetical protein
MISGSVNFQSNIYRRFTVMSLEQNRLPEIVFGPFRSRIYHKIFFLTYHTYANNICNFISSFNTVMLFEKKHCVKFNKYTLPHAKKNFSFFVGFLLALLPKCPFCFIAFSSTFVLCDEAGTFTDTHTHSSTTTILLSTLFCAIALVSLFLNYRDSRIRYALLLVLAGSLIILLSVTKVGGLALYYSGVAFVFCGVWLNGNLLFFAGKIRTFFTKKSINQMLNFNDQSGKLE